jgi:hypothetical protein
LPTFPNLPALLDEDLPALPFLLALPTLPALPNEDLPALPDEDLPALPALSNATNLHAGLALPAMPNEDRPALHDEDLPVFLPTLPALPKVTLPALPDAVLPALHVLPAVPDNALPESKSDSDKNFMFIIPYVVIAILIVLLFVFYVSWKIAINAIKRMTKIDEEFIERNANIELINENNEGGENENEPVGKEKENVEEENDRESEAETSFDSMVSF